MKMNRMSLLLLILVLIMGISAGCSKTPKAPEGVGQDFYDDMLDCSEDLIKVVKNAKITFIADSDILKSDGYNKIKTYIESEEKLTLLERNILSTIEELYFKVAMYYDGVATESDIKDLATTFSSLMEIKFDVDKVLLK